MKEKIKLVKIYGINLIDRRDRKREMMAELDKYFSTVSRNIFQARRHPRGGVVGCRDSHLSVLRLAKSDVKNGIIMVVEDDVVFEPLLRTPLNALPNDDWVIAYIGHNTPMLATLQSIPAPPTGSMHHWLATDMVLTTHCYLVNMKHVDKIIDAIEMANDAIPVDVAISQGVGAKYVLYPIGATQRVGKSDVAVVGNGIVDYNELMRRPMIRTAPFEIRAGVMKLRLGEHEMTTLPIVYIVTITYNRSRFLELTRKCIGRQSYPADQIRWIIVDDSDGIDMDTIDVKDNVTHIKLARRHNIAEKRNMGARRATEKGAIIVHMDDDDYYESDYIATHVTLLLDHPKIDCTGSTVILCYDLQTRRSFSSGQNTSIFGEASMAYRRRFLDERGFNESDSGGGEAASFLAGRYDRCMQVPCQFMMIAMTHGGNMTLSRKARGEGGDDIWRLIPIDFRATLTSLVTN